MAIRELPSMVHTFTIEVKGSDTGQNFQGTFTFTRPSLRVQSQIEKTEARLNEGMESISEDLKYIHKMVAYLKHTLSNTPEWWVKSDHGLDLYDINVVFELWKAVTAFNNNWWDKVWSEEEKKQE